MAGTPTSGPLSYPHTYVYPLTILLIIAPTFTSFKGTLDRD